MNTLQILNSLKKLNVPSHGVFPMDRIPRSLGRPAGIVINTDDHRHKGQHWIALFVTSKGKGIFFDSFGQKPTHKHVKDVLRKNTSSYIWNTKQLQGLNSNVCGQYCVMFLHYMNQNYSLNDFCNLFSNNFYKNDCIVFNFQKNIQKARNKKKYISISNNNYNKNYVGNGSFKNRVWVQSCMCKIQII